MTANSDEKHLKYNQSFKPNDKFYGLGIENETYFVVGNKNVSGGEIIDNRKRERYSVDYYTNFKADDVNKFFHHIDRSETYTLPIFMNAYAIKNCDKNGSTKTLYDKAMTPNAKYSGQSLEDFVIEQSETLNNMYKTSFCYDGDTIEFMTQKFYKTTVNECVNELKDIKETVLEEFNKVFTENNIYARISYPEYNYGFAKYTTNMNNVSICNNSTYHINITMPTLLDNNCNIKNYSKFIKNHKRAIKYIQWVEPLIIACYGSADIFSIYNSKFSKCSLRNALSRYISIGTFNPESMKEGRLLNDYDHLFNKNWFHKYHQESGYMPPSTIGYDINFKNFRNHGIEIRIFDYFPENLLPAIINFIVLLCELSLDKGHVANARIGTPHKAEFWNQQTFNCIKDGSECELNIEYVNYLAKLFNINDISVSSCLELLQVISDDLYDRYSTSKFASEISPNMSRPRFIDYNALTIQYHKNLLENINVINNTEIIMDSDYVDMNTEYDELSDLSENTIIESPQKGQVLQISNTATTATAQIQTSYYNYNKKHKKQKRKHNKRHNKRRH